MEDNDIKVSTNDNYRGELASIEPEQLSKVVWHAILPADSQKGAKRRKILKYPSSIVIPVSTTEVPVFHGIERYTNQVMLLHDKILLKLSNDTDFSQLLVSLNDLFSRIFPISSENGKNDTFRVPCRLSFTTSTNVLELRGLQAWKFASLLHVDTKAKENIDLFLQAMSTKALNSGESHMIIPPSMFVIEKVPANNNLDFNYRFYVEFGIALSNSAVTSVPAAENTTLPIFGRLLSQAFPTLDSQRIKYLIPPKAFSKLHHKDAFNFKPRPKVNVVDFYKAISSHKRPDPPRIVQHSDLITSFLPYQAQTIQWCLKQEGKIYSKEKNAFIDIDESSIEFPPWSWTKVEETDYWISPELGQATCTESQLRHDTLNIVKSGAKGLIAEEMGLGKSLEAIGLLLLNQRPKEDIGKTAVDLYSGEQVIKTKTTLIITPSSIHKQWIEEFQKHAPSLSVYVYHGAAINPEKRITHEVLMNYDAVLTTYSVISREIHFAKPLPTRAMRQERKYAPFRSPLVALEFWRVLLDEVQLVESGSGNAAQVAKAIPRHHAWGVSGTPIRNDLSDLAGLLQFLRFFPFLHGHNMSIWERLCTDSTLFCDLFQRISIRHTKDMVKDDIALPPQTRLALTIPFTTVEENNYRHLFQDFLDDCGLRPDGSPTRDDWDPNEELSKMSKWLGRLRQTCCHPQIGTGNKKALGGGPLRTVNEVLVGMYDSALSNVYFDERSYWVSKIQRGQLFEQAQERDKALILLNETLEGIRKILNDYRSKLTEESEYQAEFRQKVELEAKEDQSDMSDESRAVKEMLVKEAEDNFRSRIQTARARVRAFLELEHRCLFFIASIYFQQENKELEDKFYILAEDCRRELLQESEFKAQKLMDTMAVMAKNQEFVEIPDIDQVDEYAGGLEGRSLINRAREICGILNEQANKLDEWREKVIGLLGQNLVDKDAEPDGEEYGESLDAQEEGFSYQEAIRQALADRSEAVTGRKNNLVEYDVDLQDQLNQRTDLATQLLKDRKAYQVPPHLGSLKFVVDEIRRLLTQLKTEAETSGGERIQRLEIECTIISKELDLLRNTITSQKKTLEQLEKELVFYRSVYNARIDYYKQLQQISDGVATFIPAETKSCPEKIPLKFPKQAQERENKLLLNIDKGYARLRYLDHLKKSILSTTGTIPESERLCVICQSTFDIGSLTVCGHQYCRTCILEWWNTYRTCPVCKRELKKNDIYNISYKPSEIIVKEEKTLSKHKSSVVASHAIYADLNTETLNSIKSVELAGSYGSKIDMIIRHMLWLRSHDARAQVVLFSQWTDFLQILSIALVSHGIKYSSLEKKNMDEFKRNPEIMCFLLHAKSQSSGLTLINATHVIICEPLFNTALELQAISRVHRIGQTQSTTVWMYAISGSVEESVLSFATKKRVALLGQVDQRTKVSDSNLDISNSIELTRASGKMATKRKTEGEVVPEEELWSIFFGVASIHNTSHSVNELGHALASGEVEGNEALSTEYRRFMTLNATENRLNSS
ncbi:SNF2 family N-terminal domain-containing protein [Lipomyces japonicus]|uniref:SNF2 family N-terminal domain-containing protein n=1 Tax=Lipomyces japonicus TaxID=56871 RepID=UPI0034CF63F9